MRRRRRVRRRRVREVGEGGGKGEVQRGEVFVGDKFSLGSRIFFFQWY
jgi:hypothetical protein